MSTSAPHPRMHGLTHVAGGADPIPFFPSSFNTYSDMIRATPALWAYWPLSDPSGLVFEELVAGRDMTGVEYTGADPDSFLFSYGLQGPIVDDPGTSIGFIGKDSAVAADQGTHAYYQFVTGDNANLVLGGSSTFTIEAWFYPTPPVVENQAGAKTLNGYVWAVGDSGGMQLSLYMVASGDLRMQRGSSGTTATSSVKPFVGGWNHAAVTYDGTTATLYLNGSVTATLATGSISVTTQRFQLGRDTLSGFTSNYFEGMLASAAIYTEALDPDLIAQHAGGRVPGGGVHPGDVLTTDGEGGTSWEPPTVEVTGGGVNPAPVDETPADSSNPAGTGPTTSSGWHLDAHVETVVLHDPNPGRFDVPTMKWVRVPFTSITIYRTWEPTVDAEVLKTARLNDDRGLTQAAKNGVLHINPDMAWPDAPPMNVWIDDAIVSHPEHHLVEGWFSIEYPVLDARYLPENDVELLTLGPTPDAPRPGVDVLVADGYQRAARFMNVSTGSVLRFHAGSTDRSIINWWFWGTANDSTGDGDGPGTGNLDNPLPIWGDWPARPVHMTPPYPQLNPTDSKAYYKDYQGMAGNGFGPFRGLTAGTNLSAGANLCMQAWQDSPWLLRFSTGRFPAYRGFDQDYNGFPHLAVTYHYDPDTINHTTGKLLLPAT